MSDLWKLSATEIAAKVRVKEVSATEVTQSHLDRIDAVNPALNAIVQHMPDEALVAAAAVDAKIASGEDVGRHCQIDFHGNLIYRVCMKIPDSMPRLKGFRFPREVISYAVWAYHRFALSTADVYSAD